MTSKTETTDARQVRMLRWVLMDALRHASGVASRLAEMTEGTDATAMFHDARKAIVEFSDEHPAMKALASAAVRDMT